MSYSRSWRWRLCEIKRITARIFKFYIEYVLSLWNRHRESLSSWNDARTRLPKQTPELNAFNNTVTQLSNALSERSESIDKMKLQAIGQRNIYESARAERKRKRNELANLIKEKLRELDRQNAQLDSLVQVEREQQALIEKLTSSD